MPCTDANCIQIRLADRHTFIRLVESPEASRLLADGARSALMTGTSRCKTPRHSFRAKSEKLSYLRIFLMLLFTAVGTNDVIGMARVSNGVLCIVTKRHLKFTFS